MSKKKLVILIASLLLVYFIATAVLIYRAKSTSGEPAESASTVTETEINPVPDESLGTTQSTITESKDESSSGTGQESTVTQSADTVITPPVDVPNDAKVSDENYVYDPEKFDMEKGWDLRGHIYILGNEFIDPLYKEHLNQIADEFSACLYAEYDFIDAPETIIMLPYQNSAILEVNVGFETVYYRIKYHEEGGFYMFIPVEVDPDEVVNVKEGLLGEEDEVAP